MRRALLLLLMFASIPHATADDVVEDAAIESEAMEAGDPDARPSRRRFDYSRFSNGPRNVPTPRGASQERAEALGLGTRGAADRVFHRRVDPRWVEAAGGDMPDTLRWPVELGRFGRGFGLVRRSRPDLPHRGVDIVADEGSTIRAVAPGIVAYSDNEVRGYGNIVAIVHPNGWVSIYAHCVRTTVQAGWRVNAGERIGFVGSTGISRGPHLHFEVRDAGHAIDPLPHFEGRPWITAYREWRDLRAAGRYREPTGYLAENLPPDAAARRSEARPTSRTRAPEEDDGALDDVHRLLREGASAAELEGVEGETFPTLLWPVRGGERGGDYAQPRGVNIRGEAGAAVRAAADGLIVYVGEGLRGLGKSVALLHPDGALTLYGSNAETHVEIGQQVRRGEWIARVGDTGGGPSHLHFQLRRAGEVQDPTELFVQAPR